MRILMWRKLQSLSEKPELVILAGAGSVHELDRVNNQERAKFYVEPGDVVRVVVSGSGAFAFDSDQMFALVWSSTLVEQHHSEGIQCTEWDPERECISRVSGKMGVMRCIPEEMEWGECLEVKQRGCEPGEAWYGHLQRCGCYQHIPCRVGGFEINAVTTGDCLMFGQPQVMDPKVVAALSHKDRFQPITLLSLQKLGVDKFCWINPGEYLVDGQDLAPFGAFGYHNESLKLFTYFPLQSLLASSILGFTLASILHSSPEEGFFQEITKEQGVCVVKGSVT